MSPIYGYVTKLFLESEFQHIGNKQTKKTRILSKILWFSWQEQIQKIKLFNCFTEKDKKYLDKIVIIRTGIYQEQKHISPFPFDVETQLPVKPMKD